MVSEQEASDEIYKRINKILKDIRQRHTAYGKQPDDDKIIKNLSECIDHRDAEQLQIEVDELSTLKQDFDRLKITIRNKKVDALVDRYCDILNY